jgi:hypothetical protein
VLTCQADKLSPLAVDHKTNGGTPIVYNGATARSYDGVDVSDTVSCSPASGSRFAAGSTVVTCSTPSGDSCRCDAGALAWLAGADGTCPRSFRVSVPLAQYRFYAEAAGTRSNGATIAADRAGTMDLFGYNGASIVYDATVGTNVLSLSNAPVAPKPANYAPAIASAAANAGPRDLSLGRTVMAHVQPSVGGALGQQSGGAL